MMFLLKPVIVEVKREYKTEKAIVWQYRWHYIAERIMPTGCQEKNIQTARQT